MVGSGSNPFPSSGVSAGGNPFQGQWNPMQGSYSSQGMSSGGNPFLGQNIPMQGIFPSQGVPAGGNPTFPYGNQMGGGFPPFNQGQQGFTQNPGPSTSSSWKPGASTNPGYSFLVVLNPKLPIHLVGILGPNRGYLFWKH
jgi:hypothetical protein